MPKIFVFGPGDEGIYYALAQDGTVLGSHLCSDEGFASHDLGVRRDSRPDRHVEYAAHYPNGYEMEFVPSRTTQSHVALQEAIRLNRQSAETQSDPPPAESGPTDSDDRAALLQMLVVPARDGGFRVDCHYHAPGLPMGLGINNAWFATRELAESVVLEVARERQKLAKEAPPARPNGWYFYRDYPAMCWVSVLVMDGEMQSPWLEGVGRVEHFKGEWLGPLSEDDARLVAARARADGKWQRTKEEIEAEHGGKLR